MSRTEEIETLFQAEWADKCHTHLSQYCDVCVQLIYLLLYFTSLVHHVIFIWKSFLLLKAQYKFVLKIFFQSLETVYKNTNKVNKLEVPEIYHKRDGIVRLLTILTVIWEQRGE